MEPSLQGCYALPVGTFESCRLYSNLHEIVNVESAPVLPVLLRSSTANDGTNKPVFSI